MWEKDETAKNTPVPVLPYRPPQDDLPRTKPPSGDYFTFFIASCIGTLVYAVVLGLVTGEFPEGPAVCGCVVGALFVGVPGVFILCVGISLRRWNATFLLIGRDPAAFGAAGFIHSCFVLGAWQVLGAFGFTPLEDMLMVVTLILTLAAVPVVASMLLLKELPEHRTSAN